MASCPNKNTAEYRALQEVYKTELKTNNIIFAWQKAKNTDVFPSVEQANTFLKNNKTAYALKQRSFGVSVIQNLRRKGLIHNYKGYYLINNSYNNSMVYDESALVENHNRVLQYLKINNIPLESIDIERTSKSFKISTNDSVFTPKDIMPSSRAWNEPRSRNVVMHLKRLFPQVSIKMLSVKEAEALHDSLPKWKKTSAPFSEVNSFYIDGTAYLIKGRVTDETAIEEMLHPFIDAIKIDNEDLFNNLLAEAKVNFPEMSQQITDAYNKDRNFTELEIELEIVTQALSRHFNNEYSDLKPTKSFLKTIEEALEWFKDLIKNLYKYTVGESLPVSAIKDTATFTQVAKLLNTTELQFGLTSKAGPKVRYSLSPAKQSILDGALDGATVFQAEVIKKLFQVAVDSTIVVDSLSVSLNPNLSDSKEIVILREEDHTYLNLTEDKVYLSATTAIKGKLTNLENEAILRKASAKEIKEAKQADLDKLESVQFNLDLGNDIDTIVETVVTIANGSDINSLENTIPKMSILDAAQTEEMLENMTEIVRNLMPQGGQGKALSQVVVFDEATGIAGTADLVIIDRAGRISILDLKTSKNSIEELYYPKGSVRRKNKYESKGWNLPADSKLRQDSKEKLGREVTSLSTKGQHNLQVNLYRRMFENMGYMVNDGDFSASTFHIQMDVKGKGKNQKYLGTWTQESTQHHNNVMTETRPSENGVYVDMLIPSTVKPIQEGQEIFTPKKKKEKSPTDPPEPPIDKIVDPVADPETYTIFGALEGFLIALEKVQQTTKQKSIFISGTAKEHADRMAKLFAYISGSINKGPLEQSRAYTAVLRDALAQVRDFTEYVADPKNISKPDYITYVLNFNTFLSTFDPLYQIEELGELNVTQKQLIQNLQIERNKLIGGRALKSGKEGLVNDAIFNFVKELLRSRSNRNYGEEGSEFDEARLIRDLTQIDDITAGQLQTADMDTSQDPLLALIAKIYKRQKQILLDKIDFRKSEVLKMASLLQKLSPNISKQELYNFMLEFDEVGNRTGQYTKLIGPQYYSKAEELKKATRDADGVPLQYHDITNLDDASDKDIEENIDLAYAKRAYSNFSKAERSDESGKIIDGEYHHYTQEFIDARNKFERPIPGKNGFIKWVQKSSSKFNAAEYKLFENKYYNFQHYTSALNGTNNLPSGQIKKNTPGRFVKADYIEPNAWRLDENGNELVEGDMRSEKYKALYDPSKTDAKSIAQRNFYEFFIRYYEEELLTKLGDKVLSQMTGKIPLVRDALASDLVKEGNVVTRLWANSTRSVSNLFSETATMKQVLLDEQGNFMPSMPIFFTGSPRIDGALEAAQAELKILEDKYLTNDITATTYKKDKSVITGRIAKLRAQPTLGEISGDLANSLIKFSAMAEHFEIMGQIEDTLQAIKRVVENRKYEPADPGVRFFGRSSAALINSAAESIGFQRDSGAPDNTIRRVRKFMSMVYYDNEMVTKGVGEKLADGLISASSLAYVGFNPFGNFNNYLVGRINNNIEMLGSRFYSKKNYFRASEEWNKQAVQGILHRTAIGTRDAADVLTLGKAGIGKNDYVPDLPNNKYEALVELFRMMDSSTDIRESGRGEDSKGIWERFKSWGYVLQDAAEYNVQTKVGIALLMDINLIKPEKNSAGEFINPETMSLYDAFNFDSATHSVKLMDGYTHVLNKNGTIVEFNDDFRYEMRNKIREVNKQIHGNYAREDRMVIQSHTLGNLAAQFHKWVAPAVRARFRTQYFDENLGWMEGRYLSAIQFSLFIKKEIFQGKRDYAQMKKDFLKSNGADGLGRLNDQKAENKLFGFYRTIGEIGIILSVSLINTILSAILSGDDDDYEAITRLKNLTTYQSDRLYKELVLFMPITPTSWEQIYQMGSSPIASAKMLGDIGEFANLALWTPLAMLWQSEEDFLNDSTYVYQNNPKKGEYKVSKAFRDIVPIWRTMQKWENAIKKQDFFIK